MFGKSGCEKFRSRDNLFVKFFAGESFFVYVARLIFTNFKSELLFLHRRGTRLALMFVNGNIRLKLKLLNYETQIKK